MAGRWRRHEAGDEIEGGASPAAFRRATICVSSGGMRGELQVLFHGTARGQAQSGGGRNCGQIAAVLRDQGVEPRGSGVKYRIHGHGRTFFEL